MRLLALPLVVAAVLATIECRADESPPPSTEAALLAGAASMVLPLAVGSTLVGQGDDLHVRNLGVGVAEGGLVLAPFIAHAVVGEPRRGLFFSAVPAAFALGTTALLLVVPDTIDGGALRIQYTFAALFIGASLGATIGVVDSLFADGRARDRAKSAAPKLTLFPTVVRGQFGFAVGGAL
jgi:hypothetical protein